MITLMTLMLLSAAPDVSVNVYDTKTQWRDVDGREVTLDAFKGRPVVLSFVYTSCVATCPLTTQKLKALDARLTAAGRQTPVVVISLDPAKDTPEAVAAYRAKHKLEGLSHWHVLVGDEAQVRAFTMMLEFRYSKNPESGIISHDNAVFLIGADGQVRSRVSSLTDAVNELIPMVPAVQKKAR